MGIKAKAGFQSLLPRLVRITQLIVIRGVVRAAGGISFLLSNLIETTIPHTPASSQPFKRTEQTYHGRVTMSLGPWYWSIEGLFYPRSANALSLVLFSHNPSSFNRKQH
jgi:hypothetical protein